MYCKIADVEKWHDSGESDSEIESAIREAMELIDRECNDHFEPDERIIYFDGTGHSDILFPEKIALSCLEISEIVLVDPADGSTETVDSSDYKVYAKRVTLLYDVSLRASARWGTNAPIWPRGEQNVKITAKWGWNKTPRNITKACAILSAQILEDEENGLTTSDDIKSAKLGDFSFTLGGGSDGESDLTGNSKVDRLISNYINNFPLLGVI